MFGGLPSVPTGGSIRYQPTSASAAVWLKFISFTFALRRPFHLG
jgi:hypothetical protein